MKRRKPMLVYDCDVLVIGGGAAGARAAIEASRTGQSVAIVEKREFGYSGASGIHPGWLIAATTLPSDNTDSHFKDTIRSSGYLSNQKLVRILVEEASEAALELERLGAIFLRGKNGELFPIQMGGHSTSRTLGPSYMWIIATEVRRIGIPVFEETMITSLLKANNSVVGATGINARNGLFCVFRAKSTVLASGGAGQIYGWGTVAARSTNPVESTGDGYALAYEAGAELVDMEFVQFLLGLVFPPQFTGVGLLGPNEKDGFHDKDGVFWMTSVPLNEMTRSRMCKEILSRIRIGKGSPHGGMWYDPHDTLKEFETISGPLISVLYDQWRKAGYNVPQEHLEIYPTAHHFMGGIAIDENCSSTVSGLYACGEVTGGIHGANRLGSNSFSDCLVFGKRAGEHAAKRALSIQHPDINWHQVDKEFRRVNSILEKDCVDELLPHRVRNEIQNLMWDKVSVFKNAKDLESAISALEKIKCERLPKMCVRSKTKACNYEWIEALEAYNMTVTAEMVVRASILRRESRGAHQRDDCPTIDDKNWLSNIYIRKVGSKMTLKKKSVIVTEMPLE